jgi:hypothetical protein
MGILGRWGSPFVRSGHTSGNQSQGHYLQAQSKLAGRAGLMGQDNLIQPCSRREALFACGVVGRKPRGRNSPESDRAGRSRALAKSSAGW